MILQSSPEAGRCHLYPGEAGGDELAKRPCRGRQSERQNERQNARQNARQNERQNARRSRSDSPARAV